MHFCTIFVSIPKLLYRKENRRIGFIKVLKLMQNKLKGFILLKCKMYVKRASNFSKAPKISKPCDASSFVYLLQKGFFYPFYLKIKNRVHLY